MDKGKIMFKDMMDVMKAEGSNGKCTANRIKFVTVDIKRGTGGDIVEIEDAILCVGKDSKGKVIYNNPVSDSKFQVSGSGRKSTDYSAEVAKRHPHHYVNNTRNFHLAVSRQIRKVHLRLILEFNGMQVIP
jgi:hypothetical protein